MEGRVEGRLGSEVVGVKEGNLQAGLMELKALTDQYLTARLSGPEDTAKPKVEDAEAEES